MGKFGTLKEKILVHITEAYSNKDTDSVKTILNKIKDKDFKEVYLFYENFENKVISDESIVDLYINESETLLKEKLKTIREVQSELENLLKDVELVNENKIYSLLDNLTESTNLNNVEEKIKTKSEIKKHLLTNKNTVTESSSVFVSNENLLLAVLTNDFNNKYTDFLSEDEKKTFKEIVNLSEDELDGKFVELKEGVITKLDSLISGDPEVDNKINETKDKIMNENFKSNKINYLTILDLNNSL